MNFVILTKDKTIVKQYFATMERRFNEENILKVFFRDYSYHCIKVTDGLLLTCVNIEIGVPAIWKGLIPIALFFWLIGWFIPAVILVTLSQTLWFWFSPIWVYATRREIYKTGYNMICKKISYKKAFQLVILR